MILTKRYDTNKQTLFPSFYEFRSGAEMCMNFASIAIALECEQDNNHSWLKEV